MKQSLIEIVKQGMFHVYAVLKINGVDKSKVNPGCQCCGNWANLMEQAGFMITMSDDPDLAARRKALGVPELLTGCHLAQIGRYIIEGHVPVDDILRLLDEQPDAMGLAVPGMPAGSPGMETESNAEKYSVLLFEADGTSKIYSQH
jgi:hypothetical protein